MGQEIVGYLRDSWEALPRLSSLWGWLLPRVADVADRSAIPAAVAVLAYVLLTLRRRLALTDAWASVAGRFQRRRQGTSETLIAGTRRIDPDRAITHGSEDRLGFLPRAQALEVMLGEAGSADGSVVVAITGPWGSGKTSFLNLALLSLRQQKNRVVEFEPWFFDSDADLQREFFEVLERELRGDSPEVARTVARYLAALEGVHWIVRALGTLVRHDPPDLRQRRAALSSALRNLPHPLLIVLDDVDRLQGAQVSAIMRLVKAHANLPNLVFVLPIDRQVVAAHLSGPDGVANDYLGKIVQVEVPVPSAHPAAIQEILRPDFEDAVNWESLNDEQRGRWTFALHWGAADLLRTPRDVQRFLNALRLTMPAMKHVVDPVDFAFLTLIRMAEPAVYEAMNQRKREVLRTGWDDLVEGHRRERPPDIEMLMKRVQDESHEKAVRFLLDRLLKPNESHRPKRLVSEEYYGAYFEMAPPPSVAGWEEVNAWLSLPHFPGVLA